MQRLLIYLAFAALLALVPAGSASAKGFSFGVAAGEITSSSAILWARPDSRRATMLEVATDRRFRDVVEERTVTPRRSDDNTVQALVRGLRPGRTYYYRWLQRGGRRSDVGRFETAPRASANRTVNFAFSGDADGFRFPGAALHYNSVLGSPEPLGAQSFGVYRRMAEEGNDFNVNLGDVIYSDSEVRNSGPVALTTRQKWAKYRQNLAVRNLRTLRANTGHYPHWDDHEFVDDFSIPERGQAVYNAGVTAFRDYNPVTYSRSRGIYRSFRWGRNAEFFYLDLRSFRDAKASAGGVCNNPQTGRPDNFPTLPQERRNFLALFSSDLSQPVSQECKNRINDPNRSMLGSAQRQRFLEAIRRSTATFKIVMNEVTMQQYYAFNYDRWEGYAHERRQILESLQANGVKNVVFLTTDDHANHVNVVRMQTLEEGGPIDTPYQEFVTGPVSTRTFETQIDETTEEGNGDALRVAFLKPPPPAGVGMKCAALDVYSYAQVEVTRSQMTITAKNVNGDVVQEEGSPRRDCVLTIPAQ
jgi:alkaline phosphatase D